jgi:hypothetical protein
VALLSLVGLVAIGLAVAIAGAPPARHRDGDGPLASLNEPGGGSMAVDVDAADSRRFTFGLRLCRSGAGPAPVIRRIAPRATVGSGFAYLGSRVRTFRHVPGHTGIISVEGFPPDPAVVPDQLSDAIGYHVTTSCDTDIADGYTELLVGLELTSADGGGWDGLLVEYEFRGSFRSLEINHGMFVCGTVYPVCDWKHN